MEVLHKSIMETHIHLDLTLKALTQTYTGLDLNLDFNELVSIIKLFKISQCFSEQFSMSASVLASGMSDGWSQKTVFGIFSPLKIQSHFFWKKINDHTLVCGPIPKIWECIYPKGIYSGSPWGPPKGIYILIVRIGFQTSALV